MYGQSDSPFYLVPGVYLQIEFVWKMMSICPPRALHRRKLGPCEPGVGHAGRARSTRHAYVGGIHRACVRVYLTYLGYSTCTCSEISDLYLTCSGVSVMHMPRVPGVQVAW